MRKKLGEVLEATPDAKGSVQFYRQHSAQLLQMIGKPNPNQAFPQNRPPIVAVLLQPVSNGDAALATVLEPARVYNTFRIDMYGFFRDNPTYRFVIKVMLYDIDANGNVLQTHVDLCQTQPIIAWTATGQTVNDALVATGKISTGEIDVSIGNLIEDDRLVDNQAMRFMKTERNNLSLPSTKTYAYAGCWYIGFTATRFQNKAVAIQILNSDNSFQSVQTVQSLIARNSSLVPGAVEELVYDIHQCDVTGPLVGGTVVVCLDIPNIGYSIVSASPREFFIGNQ